MFKLIKTGVCSVTFRKESVDTIIKRTKQANLDGIEWAADVHVQPGDSQQAECVAKEMKEAGLEVLSYGSYYRAGATENGNSFETILKTAKQLGAPSIRIWAGIKGSEEASEKDRQQVTADIQRIAELAQAQKIAVHIEYHGGTLTDTSESAKQLVEDINHNNVKLYWQPAVGIEVSERVKDIQVVKPFLKHVHVFYWKEQDRLPLAEGVGAWRQYLHHLHLKDPHEDQHFLLEFVQDEDPEQFQEDAQVLLELISEFELRAHS
nr:TIM barrel protein [Alkalicoccobacillus murimartini]